MIASLRAAKVSLGTRSLSGPKAHAFLATRIGAMVNPVVALVPREHKYDTGEEERAPEQASG